MITIALIRGALPRPVLGALLPAWRHAWNAKYGRNLRHHHISRDRILILGTIPKSGLHFTRFFFANYVRLLNGTANSPATPTEMYAMFPNHWHRSYFSIGSFQTPTPELKLLGLDDITFEHMRYQAPYWNDSRVLHLYRNPLDYAVSWFYHAFEYRSSRVGTVSGPPEVLDRKIDDYAEMYLSYREAASSGNTNILRLSYEDLISNPHPAFTKILTWLGVEVEPSLVERAANYSSKETIARFEGSDSLMSQVEDFTGRFVRDGSIGQWKEYFDEAEVRRIELRLRDFGIELDEFTLEA